MKTIDTTNYSILREAGLSIVQVTQENIGGLESKIIQAYKQVFNASAWREGVKCNNLCGFKTIFEEAPKSCPNCSGDIVDFYSDIKLSEAIRKVMSKSYYQILVLLNSDQVVGFTWGWKDSLSNINSDKLKLPSVSVLDKKLSEEGISETNSWYYQSETGIIPSFRTRGVGTELVRINEDMIRANPSSIEAIIQRTSTNSPMYNIRKGLGYKEIYQYGDTDKRVLFAKNNT